MELTFYSVKLLNLFYIGIFYFVLGTAVASFVTYITPNRDNNKLKKTGTVRLYCETIILAALLFIMIYFCRKIVKLIGSPFHNIAGFDFYKLKELNGGIVLSLSLILFSPKLINMTRELSERFGSQYDDDNSLKNTYSIIKSIKEEYKLLTFILVIVLLLISLYLYRKYTGGFEMTNNINNVKNNKKIESNNTLVAINSGNNSGDGGI